MPLYRTRLGEGLSLSDTYPAVLVHLEVRRGVLLEGGGEGDLGDHGHAVPLLGLLAHVESLGGEVLVILSVLGHVEQLCDCVVERPGLEWRLTGILLPHIQLAPATPGSPAGQQKINTLLTLALLRPAFSGDCVDFLKLLHKTYKQSTYYGVGLSGGVGFRLLSRGLAEALGKRVLTLTLGGEFIVADSPSGT